MKGGGEKGRGEKKKPYVALGNVKLADWIFLTFSLLFHIDQPWSREEERKKRNFARRTDSQSPPGIDDLPC